MTEQTNMPLLDDIELRQLVRESWMRQARLDEALERRLSKQRLVTHSTLAPARTGETHDLFYAKPDK